MRGILVATVLAALVPGTPVRAQAPSGIVAYEGRG